MSFLILENGSYLLTEADDKFLVEESSPTVALSTPLDSATIIDTTPSFTFTGTDPDGDDVIYEFQLDTVNTFDSHSGSPLLDKTSNTDSGFSL